MAWTIIPDSDIDPDSPVTTGLMTALRDNVAAAFAADSGAPKIVEDAHTAITAGTSYRHAHLADERSGVSTSYSKTTEDIVIPRSGTYQVSFECKRVAGTANARIYKNASTSYTGDTALGTVRSLTTSYVEYTQTFTFNAGDLISIYTIISGATAYIKNFTLESAIKQFG